jgi:hypothetical protein
MHRANAVKAIMRKPEVHTREKCAQGERIARAQGGAAAHISYCPIFSLPTNGCVF